MTENALEIAKWTGYLTADQVITFFIKAEDGKSAKRKLDGWLSGYKYLGGRKEPLDSPLKSFSDGRTILIKLEWLQEFWALNSEHLDGNPKGEGVGAQ